MGNGNLRDMYYAKSLLCLTVSTVSGYSWGRRAHMMFVMSLIHTEIVNMDAVGMRVTWTWIACKTLSLSEA